MSSSFKFNQAGMNALNRDIQAAAQKMLARTQQAVDRVSSEYAGRPVDEVRTAFASAWASSNDGASITDPELGIVATAISQGKRVWLEDDGRLMTDD